jgi:hypothetical protein
MIHHGSEGGVGPANFGTPEFQGFVDYIMKPQFGFLLSTRAIHDYAEFFGGIFFALGVLINKTSGFVIACDHAFSCLLSSFCIRKSRISVGARKQL